MRGLHNICSVAIGKTGLGCISSLKPSHAFWLMENDDEQQQTSSFFEGSYYASKSDIILAVAKFNLFEKGYKPYSERRISVDGTFMKKSVGGALLVACFRNGNNEIQITGVGLVSVENEDNWTWFLKFLLSHLQPTPAFVISDRDKGLMKAMQTTAPGVPHFFCFRHLMENFNKKYKSKMLKNLAWILARSRTTGQYQKAIANITILDSSASAWLEDVGRDKWSTAYSPCPRYNTLTSNNVEAVNSVLKGIRSLPVIECFMGIERYAACKWVENVSKVKAWGVLIPYASHKVDELMNTAKWGEIDESSSSCFIVAIRSDVGIFR
nr:PREDICTED: hypothetical protein [Albugo laibachii Nc14]|eukprot:CCA16898.1 PREDICTED: hypothetical protein [Albugo laibachii Nc14]